MPIYAYKCSACGFAKDTLQKLSDVPLSICPECGADAYRKQLTAAGFQLKGSGWYVTDFRDGNKGAPGQKDKNDAKSGDEAPAAKASEGGDSKPAKDAGSSESTAAPAPAPSAPAPAPAAKPAAPAPPAKRD